MANKPLSQQRNITAVVTSMILACSRFTKVATRLFKHKVKTYGFGKDNKQISNLIYNLISKCESFILGDFSKFDGTQNEFTRSIDIEFFKSIFTKEYHTEITELFTSVNKFVYSADPTLLIDLGATRQSGSAETSISNTVLNAAVVLLGRLYQGPLIVTGKQIGRAHV